MNKLENLAGNNGEVKSGLGTSLPAAKQESSHFDRASEQTIVGCLQISGSISLLIRGLASYDNHAYSVSSH